MAEPVIDLALFFPQGGYGTIAEELKKLAAPASAVIALKRPKNSIARYIGLWHEEFTPQPDCLAALIKFMDQTPEAGMAAPAVYSGRGMRHFSGAKPPFWKILTTSRIEPIPGPSDTRPIEVEIITSPVVIMRPEMVEETGFPAAKAASLATLSRRACKLGWHLFALPGAKCRLAKEDWPGEVAGIGDICRYLMARPRR